MSENFKEERNKCMNSLSKSSNSDVFTGGLGDEAPNISEIARKLVKSGLYCKRFSILLVIISSVT